MRYLIILLLLVGCKNNTGTILPENPNDIVKYTPGDCYKSEFLDIPEYPTNHYIVLGQGSKYALPDDSKVIVIVRQSDTKGKFYTSYYLGVDGETLTKKECKELFPELKINDKFIERHLQYFLRNRTTTRQYLIDLNLPFKE